MVEGCEVLMAGTNGWPKNTRCNASRVFSPFLLAADAAEVHEGIEAVESA